MMGRSQPRLREYLKVRPTRRTALLKNSIRSGVSTVAEGVALSRTHLTTDLEMHPPPQGHRVGGH